jgi:outer membrane protein
LSAQTDKLSEAERAQRVQAIEAKQKALQRNMEDAQNDYQQQSNEVANRIGGKMLEVMDKFARQNGIGVVMDVSGQQNNVLWGSEQANITAAVVDAYNASSGVAAPPPSAPRPGAGAARPTTPRPSTGAATGAATTPKKQ